MEDLPAQFERFGSHWHVDNALSAYEGAGETMLQLAFCMYRADAIRQSHACLVGGHLLEISFLLLLNV